MQPSNLKPNFSYNFIALSLFSKTSKLIFFIPFSLDQLINFSNNAVAIPLPQYSFKTEIPIVP
jgi:hypothetical protein